MTIPNAKDLNESTREAQRKKADAVGESLRAWADNELSSGLKQAASDGLFSVSVRPKGHENAVFGGEFTITLPSGVDTLDARPFLSEELEPLGYRIEGSGQQSFLKILWS